MSQYHKVHIPKTKKRGKLMSPRFLLLPFITLFAWFGGGQFLQETFSEIVAAITSELILNTQASGSIFCRLPFTSCQEPSAESDSTATSQVNVTSEQEHETPSDSIATAPDLEVSVTPSAPVTVPSTSLASLPLLPDTYTQPSSNHYASTVPELLALLAEGGTVELAAGNYHFYQSLIISGDISLVGAGKEQTILTFHGSGALLYYRGKGAFRASNLTFTHGSESGANLLVIESGEVDIRDSVFRGAMRYNNQGGIGIWFRGDSHGVVESSFFERNALHGIQLSDRANVVLRHNEIHNNSGYGLYIKGSTLPQVGEMNLLEHNALGDFQLDPY